MLNPKFLKIIALVPLMVDAQVRMHFNMEPKDDGRLYEEVSGTAYSFNTGGHPMDVVNGVEGKAIRFNGYSHWTFGASTATDLLDDTYTLQGYVAVKSYPIETTAFFSKYIESSTVFQGIELGINPFGQVVAKLGLGSVKFDITTQDTLNRYEWNQISFTYDADSIWAKIYVNNELWAKENLGTFSIVNPVAGAVILGRSSIVSFQGPFALNSFTGILDEWRIIDGYPEFQDYEQAAEVIYPINFFYADVNRPRYHAIPDAGWMNESHGLIYDGNDYHLFYQKNATGPFWNRINWGHMASKDLVNWTDREPVLWPTEGYDSYGIWSGDAWMNDDGTPYIIYTGVDGSSAQVCIAEGNVAFENFRKLSQNPIVGGPPTNVGNRDFRDPYLFEEDGTYYFIIGSGLTSTNGGALFIYSSPDRYTWTYKGIFMSNGSNSTTGSFWEMPVFEKISNDKWLLIIAPIPENGNRARAYYWIGSFINNKFAPDIEFLTQKPFTLFDNVLAPSFLREENGDLVYMGIVPDETNANQAFNQGWANVLSILRKVEYDPSIKELRQTPHDALDCLKHNMWSTSNTVLPGGTTFRIPVDTLYRQYHLAMDVSLPANSSMEIVFAASSISGEKTIIEIDRLNERLFVNRNQSSNSGLSNGGRLADLPLINWDEPVQVELFVDGSLFDLFIGGIYTTSFRIFPEYSDAGFLNVVSKGGDLQFSAEVNRMRRCADENTEFGANDWTLSKNKSCNTIEIGSIESKNDYFQLALMVNQEGITKVSVADLNGKIVDSIELSGSGLKELVIKATPNHSIAVISIEHNNRLCKSLKILSK